MEIYLKERVKAYIPSESVPEFNYNRLIFEQSITFSSFFYKSDFSSSSTYIFFMPYQKFEKHVLFLNFIKIYNSQIVNQILLKNVKTNY